MVGDTSILRGKDMDIGQYPLTAQAHSIAMGIVDLCTLFNHLGGPVVRCPLTERQTGDRTSLSPWGFFQVHSSLVPNLPDALRSRVSARTGWLGVNIL